jgi:predicted nuclease of predicted toxin-antitoxin system
VTKPHFIVDEMLPQHLAYVIRDLGYEATHVELEGLKHAKDVKIWQWAADHNAIVISKDVHLRNMLVVGIQPRLIWIRWGNTRKRILAERFEKLWPEIVGSFNDGEWLVELASPPT